MAEILKDVGTPCGAFDLDWPEWFGSDLDDQTQEDVLLANPSAASDTQAKTGATHLLMAL